eukprot:14440772-Alexandrium_andersonii.AAC.1
MLAGSSGQRQLVGPHPVRRGSSPTSPNAPDCSLHVPESAKTRTLSRCRSGIGGATGGAWQFNLGGSDSRQ